MIDQNSQFFAILTAVGEAKQANATALGQPWTFSQMGVGDANNADPIPDRTQTRLINEWRRASVNQVRTDPANPNIIITEQVIPADVGGKWIREIALYDADGDMVAVANCAPSFKPLLVQGTGKTQIIRMNFIVANTASVVLKIDPAIVLATREYVDTQIIEALAKMDFKHSVLVATTTNTVLSGSQTIDGVLVTEGARVLVKDQAQAKDNGIYVLPASGAWKRAQDADSSAEVTPGLFVSVEKGTANSDSVWQLVTDGPITLGTTALAFEMVSGKTGVLTGTYKSVTVDKCGRVVGGTNPTTLAGHGINDAFTKTETASAVQAAIATLVGQAPAALDQLYELATAMNNDPNFATTMNNLIALKAPLANAALTGAPTAPTAALATANLQLANTLFVANALNALLTDPWALQPIGVPIPVMFGAGEPPTNKGYRYIKLTAAEAYNTGVLTGEVVTGVAPLVTAYARVNLAGSPINGNTVYLLNTERRSIRPGMGGTLQDDALQNITGKLVTGIPTFGGVSAEGVFAFTAVSGSSQTGVTGTGGVVNGMVDLTVDASRIARTSTETRVKNIGANYYMRIL